MESTVPGAKVSVAALQAQYGVSTASPDQQAAGAPAKGGAMDRVIIMHVDGRILLRGEVGPGQSGSTGYGGKDRGRRSA
jgi:hypothetical protein